MNAPKVLTLDFVTGQLRLAMVAILAYGGGRGWFTPADATFITALAGALGPLLIPWVWSIAVNYGKVSVASGSAAAAVAAVEKVDPASASSAATMAVQAAKVAAMVFVFLSVTLLVASNSAVAQTKKPLAVTGNPIADIKTDLGISQPKIITGNAEKDMHALWDKLISASNADLTYAVALAGAANTPASAIRKQCYVAILALNTQVNGMNVKDANGNPLPQPDPKLFTGVEQAAETIDNLSPQGPLFVACAGMAQLTKTNVLTLINAIVTGAAGLAAMPVIPGL